MQFLKIHALISTVIFFAVHTAAIFTDPSVPYDAFGLESESGYNYNASFPRDRALNTLGEISGVFAVNSSHIYVFHRADRSWQADDFDDNDVYTKQEFGPIKKPTIALLVDGKIVKEFGEGIFFLPHSISVDKEGNLWVTDVALHQVLKFNHDDFTKPALVLGERFKPGKDDKHFCKPTDVKVTPTGEFFVSDGYCNNRVLKFKPDGSLVTYWGGEATQSEPLNLPHSLALVEDLDLVLVADRENNRVVAYTACRRNDTGCGNFVNQWYFSGPVYAIDFDPLTKEIIALVGMDEGSFVQVVDFEANEVLEEISGSEHEGFGMGHTISALKTKSGFVVGSIIRDCPRGIPCSMAAVFDQENIHGGLYLYSRV